MKLLGRQKRHRRFTKKIKGIKERPRLVVFRSQKHMYAQLIDDLEEKILGSCSTLSKEFRQKYKDTKIKSNGVEAAKEVGLLIAKKASSLGIRAVAFDRAGYKYHGRVKALAQSAREEGLEF